MANKKFQKCVKAVCLENSYKTHEPVIVVQFKKTRSTPEFSYCPTYHELRMIILLLIEKYGQEAVFKELKLTVNIEK